MREFLPSRAGPRTLSLPRLLAIGLAARLVVDSSIQVLGPFLPIIASGLGISIVTLGRLVSLRSLMGGLAAPLAGMLADRLGARPIMGAALLAGALGMALIAVSPSLGVAAAGLVLTGFGLFAYSPVMQGFMSARIPYHKRARTLGLVEYSWPLSGILGLPLCGLLISWYGWRAPFLMLAGGLLVAACAMLLIPARPASAPRARIQPVRVRDALARLPQRLGALLHLPGPARSAWSAIAVNGLNVFAATHLGMVYGTWLMNDYGLQATGLGSIALALGVAQLGGSVLTSLVGDRFGKKRSLLLATALAAMAYALLPFLGFGLLPAISVLLCANLAFEVSMVSNLLLLSEQVPAQRVRVLTLASASVTLGSALASISGPPAYLALGMWGVGPVSALAMLVSLTLTLTLVRDAPTEDVLRPA